MIVEITSVRSRKKNEKINQKKYKIGGKLQTGAMNMRAFDLMSIYIGLEEQPEGPSPEPKMPISRRPRIRPPLDH
jgi:hypothetical protein